MSIDVTEGKLEEKLETKVSSTMTRPKNIASHQVTGDGAELVLDSDWMDSTETTTFIL